MHCSSWFVVCKRRFRQNGHKLVREYLAVRSIHAYSVFVHHLAAEMSSESDNRVAKTSNDSPTATRLLFSQREARLQTRQYRPGSAVRESAPGGVLGDQHRTNPSCRLRPRLQRRPTLLLLTCRRPAQIRGDQVSGPRRQKGSLRSKPLWAGL